ncbi:MAG: serine hydrolase [Gammaproteobacteria bacterium]|nr:serine hydrolase [Gammaproteobacteria bacterium]
MRLNSVIVAVAIFLHILLINTANADSSLYQQWLVATYPADGPGAAVIVVKDDNVLFRSASGMADMELGVPLRPEHVFRIGSLTKQFTAAAVLLLQEQGRLDVSDNINKYLPEYPTHGHTITIEHLLTHTSGIFNYTDIPGYFGGPVIRQDLTTEDVIALFSHLPMDFEPGEAHHYSNSGYTLLGAIIETVSGQTYTEFIRAEIFEPLGMVHSHHGGPQIIPNRVHGYDGSPGDYRNASFLSMTHPHASGALLSNVDDLAAWTTALFNGELLPKKSVRKMTRDYKLNSGERIGYGYGFNVGSRFGERVVRHNGGIHGFAGSAMWLPDSHVYVAVLSNFQNRSTSNLASRLAFHAADANYPRFEPFETDNETLTDYVGDYQINENQSRRVIEEDGRLYTQRTGRGRSEIVAYARDAFFYPGLFTHLKFDRDRTGRVVAMRMYHDGAKKAEIARRVNEVVDPDGE